MTKLWLNETSYDTFEEQLELLFRLGHFVCDRWPTIDDLTWESVKAEVCSPYSSFFIDAVKSYQHYNSGHVPGFVVDGEFGPKTMALMQSRRCGSPDRMGAGGRSRWAVSDLLVWHDMTFTGLTNDTLKALYLQAFAEWTKIANIRAAWVTSNSDRPNVYAHARRIDGVNKILAWSMLPPAEAGSNVQLEQRYDSSEAWAAQVDTLLAPTMIHELGHAIGLDHDPDPDSIMFAMMNGTRVPNESDRRKIQALYPLDSQPPPPPPPPPPGKTILRSSSMQVVIDGKTYRYTDEQYLEG